MESTHTTNLPQDGVILRNLKRPSYKLSVSPLEGRVTSMTSEGNSVFIALAGKGILVFRVANGQSEFCYQVGNHRPVSKTSRAEEASQVKDIGITCHEMTVSEKYLVYVKDNKGSLSICVHEYTAVAERNYKPLTEKDISRRAPLVVDHHLDLLVIGCAAWTVSWTSTQAEQTNTEVDTDESYIRSMDLASLKTTRQWKVTDNTVSLLRRQRTRDHSMLGVADSRTGLRVYDLGQPTAQEYLCLYHVPVEEIRNFHLAGNFVAVFHKFEPNVTFWNMKEQKTILCINIQDQMRELAEEFLEDEEGDFGLYGDDDDHVTSVTSVASDDDFVLLYGTKSGCVFGMSVNKRLKLFNIPCPHEVPEKGAAVRRGIHGLRYLPEGQLAVCYEKYGLTVMNFNLENPPDRPPTRCQKRE